VLLGTPSLLQQSFTAARLAVRTNASVLLDGGICTICTVLSNN